MHWRYMMFRVLVSMFIDVYSRCSGAADKIILIFFCGSAAVLLPNFSHYMCSIIQAVYWSILAHAYVPSNVVYGDGLVGWQGRSGWRSVH